MYLFNSSYKQHFSNTGLSLFIETLKERLQQHEHHPASLLAPHQNPLIWDPRWLDCQEETDPAMLSLLQSIQHNLQSNLPDALRKPDDSPVLTFSMNPAHTEALQEFLIAALQQQIRLNLRRELLPHEVEVRHILPPCLTTHLTKVEPNTLLTIFSQPSANLFIHELAYYLRSDLRQPLFQSFLTPSSDISTQVDPTQENISTGGHFWGSTQLNTLLMALHDQPHDWAPTHLERFYPHLLTSLNPNWVRQVLAQPEQARCHTNTFPYQSVAWMACLGFATEWMSPFSKKSKRPLFQSIHTIFPCEPLNDLYNIPNYPLLWNPRHSTCAIEPLDETHHFFEDALEGTEWRRVRLNSEGLGQTLHALLDVLDEFNKGPTPKEIQQMLDFLQKLIHHINDTHFDDPDDARYCREEFATFQNVFLTRSMGMDSTLSSAPSSSPKPRL